jgi:hypothetical protein
MIASLMPSCTAVSSDIHLPARQMEGGVCVDGMDCHALRRNHKLVAGQLFEQVFIDELMPVCVFVCTCACACVCTYMCVYLCKLFVHAGQIATSLCR